MAEPQTTSLFQRAKCGKVREALDRLEGVFDYSIASSAICANGVKNAVFLSSYGAHQLDDAGAISGMGLAEVVLNKLDCVNVLSLRAGYFYSNLPTKAKTQAGGVGPHGIFINWPGDCGIRGNLFVFSTKNGDHRQEN
jgi:hypothetical protein